MFAFFLILFIGERGQDGFAYRKVEFNHWQPGTETGNNTNTLTHTVTALICLLTHMAN